MNNLEIKMAELNKKFKADIINKGTDIIKVAKIPFSSPMANYMTYGGVPVGKITEFFGGEGGGKTTSALDIAGNAQREFERVYNNEIEEIENQILDLEDKDTKEARNKINKLQDKLDSLQSSGPKVVVYIDAEQTLDVEWAKLIGVDTEAMYLVRPQEQTAEEVLQIAIDLISTGNVGLCILDSIPMLVSQNIFDESLEKKSYGGISQALTAFCSKVTPYLVQNQCAFIGINQIREDLSSMYNTQSTPGGKMWKHACALRVRFKKDTYLGMDNEELSSRAENPAGNKVIMEIMKTKVCKPDRRLGYYTLNYTTGIDVLNDSIQLALEYNLIYKSGSWYSILDDNKEVKQIDGTPLKFQGLSKLINYLKSNEDEKLYLLHKLEERML